MELRLYDRADAPEILRLWNTAGAAAGYAPLNADTLDALLLAHPAFCGESTFVLEEAPLRIRSAPGGRALPPSRFSIPCACRGSSPAQAVIGTTTCPA